jgi:hypothetical protein
MCDVIIERVYSLYCVLEKIIIYQESYHMRGEAMAVLIILEG